MPVTEIGDPRLQALFGTDDLSAGVRPSVRMPRKGLSSTALVIIAVVLGLLLFAVLNSRRTSEAEPSENVPRSGALPVQFEVPPPLNIPPAPPPPVPASNVQLKPTSLQARASAPALRSIQPQTVYTPQPVSQPLSELVPPIAPPPPPRASAGSPLVIDSGAGVGAAGTSAAATSPVGSSSQAIGRIRASAFANRSMTIPQGALIPAVLETGFNSTKPGFARAVVSRDVRGFDGKNILVPRGSRLIGEYSSEAGQAQKRVAIIWTRLLRPDGMTIALDSPAVDTIGRGGVAASVNTHFIQRLGDALLQSTFEIGRVVAGRAISDPVVVVSAGNATAAAGQVMPATNYVPTLTVPAGKSISVFVAHDLDFSTAAGGGK